MQRVPSGSAAPGQGEYVWDELDILLDERGAPVPGGGPAVSSPILPGTSHNWMNASSGGGGPPPAVAPGNALAPSLSAYLPSTAVPHMAGNEALGAPIGVGAGGMAAGGHARPPVPSYIGPDVVGAGSGYNGGGSGVSAGAQSVGSASSGGPSGSGGGRGRGGAASGGTKRTRAGANDTQMDKDAKRRAAVAAASRATRAKRKRELEALKEKNVQLEKERETFLNTIADLQMKVQALRETGSIDLRMENDLLRAELMEHKSFISKFKRIADGMPTTTSAKKLMCKQGSDTAVAQVLGLLSTSMADPSWRTGSIKGHPEIELRYQRLPHGVSANNAKRVSVRIDIPVIPAENVIEVAQILWGVWVDEDLNKRIGKHFGAMSVSVREVETGMEDMPLAQVKSEAEAGEALKNRVKVYYYREETPRHDLEAAATGTAQTDVVDTVLLLSSREKEISRSSFPTDERFHKWPPNAERERARYEGTLKPAQPFTLEEQQGMEGQKNYQAIVLASTSTQHSLGLMPVKPGVHRIRSALLEGAVFRKVEGGVAMSNVFSYPSSQDERVKSQHTVLVSDEGYLNDRWTHVISEMHDIIRERMPPAILDKYRKARDDGIPLPKEITDHL